MPVWMVLGLTTFGAVIALCVISREKPTKAAIAVAVANLFVAGLNMFAPYRALLDPGYVGYSFGFVEARRGVAVTIAAGTLFAVAAACAWLALKRPSRGRLLFIAVADGLLFLNIGGALLASWLQGSDFRIQLGEYLTIPGALALAILLLLLAVPLGASSFWALSRRNDLVSSSRY